MNLHFELTVQVGVLSGKKKTTTTELGTSNTKWQLDMSNKIRNERCDNSNPLSKLDVLNMIY